MSKAFGGSVVLTQNSLGVSTSLKPNDHYWLQKYQHCSISSASLCSTKYIREYFNDGTLPPEGTVCETESTIFGNDTVSDIMHTLSAEDQILLRASKNLEEMSIPYSTRSIRAPLSPFVFWVFMYYMWCITCFLYELCGREPMFWYS